MKVLVTFALAPEFAPWRRRRAFLFDHSAGLPAWTVRLGAAELRVALTGMGPHHASRSIYTLLADRPDFIISAGLCGSLRPDYRSADVLVARALSSSSSTKPLRADESLFQFAAASGARPVGLFHTCDAILRTPEDKAMLAPLAHAADMESYVILEAAAAHRMPAVAIRAVSDTHDQSLPYDFSRALNHLGHLSLVRLFGHIARRPHKLPELIRLGRSSNAAAASLASFLDDFLTAWVACAVPFDRPCEVAAT